MKMRNEDSSARPAGRRISGHAQEPQIDDPYRSAQKPAGPALCSRCGVVFLEGRWSWAPRPAAAAETTCPACRRIQDGHPAGILTLTGKAVNRHMEEIRQLAGHEEKAENREHPLNRIMDIVEQPESLVLRTTDIHLPRRIGKALQRAYGGRLDIDADKSAYFVRIAWRSE
jgi:NMD protein affecting ribosome stability and mRNA decay